MEFMFDARPDEVMQTSVGTNTSVEVADGPTKAPKTFNSISPFGSRNDSQKIWYFLIGAIGVIALVAVVLFIIKILGM
jgi:hypothetical protein